MKFVLVETPNQTICANNGVLYQLSVLLSLWSPTIKLENKPRTHKTQCQIVSLWLFPIKWWEGGCPFKTREFFVTRPVITPTQGIIGCSDTQHQSLCVKFVSDGNMTHPMHRVDFSWKHDRPWIDPRQCNYWNQKGNNIKSESVHSLHNRHFRSVKFLFSKFDCCR